MYLKIKVFLSFCCFQLFIFEQVLCLQIYHVTSTKLEKIQKDLEWKENLPLFLAAGAQGAGWCPSALPLLPPAGLRLSFSCETWRLYSGRNQLFLKQFLKGDVCFSFLIVKNCTMLLTVNISKYVELAHAGNTWKKTQPWLKFGALSSVLPRELYALFLYI